MPKPVLTLAAAWASFDTMVFDDAVTNAEKVAACRVFYAGAQSALDILLAGLDPTVEVTEREVDLVEALSDELRRFGEEVECAATNRMDVVLPHPGMLPSGSSIASPECSRPHVSLSIDYTGSALPPFAV
jgi:hypothetical protein